MTGSGVAGSGRPMGLVLVVMARMAGREPHRTRSDDIARFTSAIVSTRTAQRPVAHPHSLV